MVCIDLSVSLSRSILTACNGIAGAILFFAGSLYFRGFIETLGLRDLKPSTIGFSSEGGLDVKNHGVISRTLVIWVGAVLAVAFMVVTISFVAFRRRRRPILMDKDLE